MSDYLDDRVSGDSYRKVVEDRDFWKAKAENLSAELERLDGITSEAQTELIKDRDFWKAKAESHDS